MEQGLGWCCLFTAISSLFHRFSLDFSFISLLTSYHWTSVAVGLAGTALAIEFAGDSIQGTVVAITVADVVLRGIRCVDDNLALTGAYLDDAFGIDSRLQKHFQRHGHQNKWFACQNNHILYFKLHLCGLRLLSLEQVIIADEQFFELFPRLVPLSHGVDSGEIEHRKAIVQLSNLCTIVVGE